jgi:hypothetical protein
MKQVIDGNGNDSTSATWSYLTSNHEFQFANLYLIGYPDDPNALWLTDWESPLWWPVWGNQEFLPASITRSTLTRKFGFDVQKLTLTWSPAQTAFNQSTSLANPYQKAQIGYYDNQPVRVWTAYMPTRGDCMTYGASAEFGGRIGDVSIERGKIQFSVTSFLDVVNQQVPQNIINLFGSGAAFTGAVPPAGFSTIPFFAVITGDSQTVVVGQNTSGGGGPNYIYGTNVFRGGYLVFQPGSDATLDNTNYSAIQQNTSITIGGTQYNQFVLYSPLPWPPTPGEDTFYVSGPGPVTQDDDPEAFTDFPYLPATELGLS